MKLWQIVQQEKKDKKQICGTLYDGTCGYCITGLIINALNKDIEIKNWGYKPIKEFIKMNNLFTVDDDDYSGNDSIPILVEKLAQKYKKTGKIDMEILYTINDKSIEEKKPFTFDDFEKLFKEMDV